MQLFLLGVAKDVYLCCHVALHTLLDTSYIIQSLSMHVFGDNNPLADAVKHGSCHSNNLHVLKCLFPLHGPWKN